MTLTATRLRTLGAVAAAALVLSACSGGNDGSGVASAGGEVNPADPAETEDTAPLDPDAQALVFAGCMRDNGVDMPDPGPGQQGLGAAFESVADDYDQETLQQAIGACQDQLPQYEQEQDHSNEELQLALAECMREQGLDVGDQPFTDGSLHDNDPGEITAAMEACNDVLTGAGG